jgi:hypothetical protein
MCRLWERIRYSCIGVQELCVRGRPGKRVPDHSAQNLYIGRWLACAQAQAYAAHHLPARAHIVQNGVRWMRGLGANVRLGKAAFIQVAFLAATTKRQTCTAPLPLTAPGKTALGLALWRVQGNDRCEHTASIPASIQSTNSGAHDMAARINISMSWTRSNSWSQKTR